MHQSGNLGTAAVLHFENTPDNVNHTPRGERSVFTPASVRFANEPPFYIGWLVDRKWDVQVA